MVTLWCGLGVKAFLKVAGAGAMAGGEGGAGGTGDKTGE